MGRFDMDKFTGKEDFGMWKYKLLGQLEIQGFASVLDEDFSIYTKAEKQEQGDLPRKDIKKSSRIQLNLAVLVILRFLVNYKRRNLGGKLPSIFR